MSEKDKTVNFTLSSLGGTVHDNINRWRGEVGLPILPPDQLDLDIVEIPVAGEKGSYVDLKGPKTDQPGGNRILGVILVMPRQTWFFKLFGPETWSASTRRTLKASFDRFRSKGPASRAA